MAQLLTGKTVVARLAEDIGKRVIELGELGITPTLALVRLGERPDDLSYERTAIKRAESLGIATRSIVLDASASQADVEAAITSVNNDASIHGCLLFRPLPKGIDERAVCDLLAPEKDVDGIGAASLASVFMDESQGYPPCTAAACLEMLDGFEIPVAGKHVVVVGRSLVIGKPVALMLLARNASVTICHSKTEDLPAMMRGADIVICATGRPRMFGAECFRPGQTVLDVGINFDENDALCGDVDFAAAEPLVDAITPVPGGLGSVTTSVLMAHAVAAAQAASKAASKGLATHA